MEEDNDFTRTLFTYNPNFSDKHLTVHLWHKEPGIYIRSRASLIELGQHFAQFVRIQDEQGKRYFFRFWETSCTYDYFSYISTIPEHTKCLFQLNTHNADWVYRLVSYSKKMERLYVVEPLIQKLADKGTTKTPYTITLAEEEALMRGVLRPYAFEIQQRIRARYPEELQDMQEKELEDRVFHCVVRMHSYGIY